MRGPRLKFCSQNDLMYQKCIPEDSKLIFYCKNCCEQIDATTEEYCILKTCYLQQTEHRTDIASDMTADPTLPITRGVDCPKCGNCQVVYQAKPSIHGMHLHYHC